MDGLDYLGVESLGEEEPEPVQARKAGKISKTSKAALSKSALSRLLSRLSLSSEDPEPEPVQAIRQRVAQRYASRNSYVGVDVIPTVAPVSYTDAKTVAAVQAALVKLGYDLGKSGPNNDGVDGLFGSKTKAAIKKMQATLGQEQTGKIDTGVVMALKVIPGSLPPGVTIEGRAAVQAQVALDAANLARHAETPTDVQIAAQAAVEAAPPAPPELKQNAQKALAKAKAATTPEQVKAAAAEVQQAATRVQEAVEPSWWVKPTWEGGPERWKTGAVAGASAAVVGGIAWAWLG